MFYCSGLKKDTHTQYSISVVGVENHETLEVRTKNCYYNT